MDIKLSFKDVNQDIERYIKKFGKPDVLSSGTPVIRGLSEAERFVVDAYYQNESWDGLINYYLGFNFVGDDGFILPLSNALQKNKQLTFLKRLWQGVIAKRKLSFWYYYKYKNQIPSVAEKTLPRHKELALSSLRYYYSILLEFDDNAQAARVAEDISLLEREERRKSSVQPDKRSMSEEIFWELIAKAKEQTDSIEEQITLLISLLESFKPSEIRQFHRILCKKLEKAYHYDIWALAFIAQNGCSDDAFEAFREWLVLQGQQVYQTALEDVRKVLLYIPDGLGSQANGLFAAIELAYENRNGKPMKPSHPKLSKIAGQEWQEEEVEKLYPEVARHFYELRGANEES